MYRVIALDLDGTLLRSDGTMSRRTFLTLRTCMAVGMRLVIATSRPPRTVVKMLPPDFAAIPWVCYNGAEVYERGERTVQNALDPALSKEIIRTIQSAAPDATVSVEIDNQLFSDRPISGPWIHLVADLYSVTARPAAKVIFDTARVADIGRLCAGLPGGCRAILTDGGTLRQVLTASASKAWALNVLLGRWKLTFGDVIAFGDDTNDIEMVEQSGIGIAMANACDEFKAVADRITLSNDDDGVAVMLEALIEETGLGGHGSVNVRPGTGTSYQ